VSLIVFFIVGDPFGAINDVGNGVLALLSGALAVTLRPATVAANSGMELLATGVAVLGSAIAVVGSVLILWDITDFFLAGLVSGTGFALIGVWLVAFNRSIADDVRERCPRRLPIVGVLAGAILWPRRRKCSQSNSTTRSAGPFHGAQLLKQSTLDFRVPVCPSTYSTVTPKDGGRFGTLDGY